MFLLKYILETNLQYQQLLHCQQKIRTRYLAD